MLVYDCKVLSPQSQLEIRAGDTSHCGAQHCRKGLLVSEAREAGLGKGVGVLESADEGRGRRAVEELDSLKTALKSTSPA